MNSTATAVTAVTAVTAEPTIHLPRSRSWQASGSSRRPKMGRRSLWVYLGLAAAVAAAWKVSHMGLYTPRSNTGYWMGVSGAVMMLLLFTYPLRKRSTALSRVGSTKFWFIVHMVLGVLGPTTVLAHSAFRVQSLNAGVALVSMLVVAASGVIGRFIYLHTHRGLGGELQTFESLRAALGMSDSATRGALHFAPEAAARLMAMQDHAGQPGDAWREHLRRLFVLPWKLRRERDAIERLVSEALQRMAEHQGWDERTLRSRERRRHRVIREYTASVLRIAQLSAYTRMFSLWHVLHVPFVFIMTICALAHVVAVHAY